MAKIAKSMPLPLRLSSLKNLPFVGPLIYAAYLRAYCREGELLTIKSGRLSDRRWVRIMRTFNLAYANGDHETPVQEATCSTLENGHIFYDVGANAGFFTLLGSVLVGPTGKVFSYEPHPKTAKALLAQMRANDASNVVVRTMALSDRKGTARLADDTDSDMANLTDDSRRRAISVGVSTLDDEARLNGTPDVIKIDVEGAELAVLAGGMKTLASRRPILLVELHSSDLARRVDALLSSLQYELTEIGSERFIMATPSRPSQATS